MSVIEVANREGFGDPAGAGALSLARELGAAVDKVETAALYLVEGELTRLELERLAAELLADPVTQLWRIDPEAGPGTAVDVWLKSQVADPTAPSVERGGRDLGLAFKARCGTRYRLFSRGGPVGAETARKVAWRALANPVVHECRIHEP